MTIGNLHHDSFGIAVPDDNNSYNLNSLVTSALTYPFPYSPIYEQRNNKGQPDGYVGLLGLTAQPFGLSFSNALSLGSAGRPDNLATLGEVTNIHLALGGALAGGTNLITAPGRPELRLTNNTAYKAFWSIFTDATGTLYFFDGDNEVEAGVVQMDSGGLRVNGNLMANVIEAGAQFNGDGRGLVNLPVIPQNAAFTSLIHSTNTGTKVKTISAGLNVAIADQGTNLQFSAGGGGGPAPSNNIPVVVTAIGTNFWIDASEGSLFQVALTGNAALGFTNGCPAQTVEVQVIQPAAGFATIVLKDNTGGLQTNWVNYGADITAVTLSTNAYKMDRFKAELIPPIPGIPNTTNRWDIIAVGRSW